MGVPGSKLSENLFSKGKKLKGEYMEKRVKAVSNRVIVFIKAMLLW